MRIKMKEFRKGLREAFQTVLRPPTAPVKRPFDVVKDEPLVHDLGSIKLSLNIEDGPEEIEDESASRERQQASGYAGAFDGPPEYGDDMHLGGEIEKLGEDEEEGGELEFDFGDMASDDEGGDLDHEVESPVELDNSEEGDEDSEDFDLGDDEEIDLDDDDEEESDEDEEESDEEESDEEESEEEDDDEEDVKEKEDSEEDDEEEVEEGVTQSKRAEHGYQGEDPTDYEDISKKKLKEAFEVDDSEQSSLGLPSNPKLEKFKSFLTSLSPQEKQQFQTELPQLMKTGAANPLESENPVSQDKAKTIMKHGEVKGNPLTDKQKGLFGAIAGGQKMRK